MDPRSSQKQVKGCRNPQNLEYGDKHGRTYQELNLQGTHNLSPGIVISSNVCVEGPKSKGAYPRAMAMARGQTFKAKPLSRRTNGTRRPEHPTEMQRGRMWSEPSGGRSSSENMIQVALPAVIIWISPSGVVVVSTLIWLKARVSASQ